MSRITETCANIKNIGIPNVKILLYNYFYFVQSWKFNNHSSSFWHLWYNPYETSSFICDNKEYILDHNTIILLPPNTIFSTKEHHVFSQFSIHFTVEEPLMTVKRKPIKINAKKIFGENQINIIMKIEDIRECRRKLAIYLYEIVFKSLTLIPDEFYVKNERVVDQRVVNAINYINEHIKLSPSNIEICKYIGMSENNFLRLFKKEMLISPQQYMSNQRIEKGRMLLISMPQVPIDEISEQIGYADRYNFSKAFKKKINMSPAEYRNKIMNLNN